MVLVIQVIMPEKSKARKIKRSTNNINRSKQINNRYFNTLRQGNIPDKRENKNQLCEKNAFSSDI